MNKKDKFTETYELKLVDSSPKKSYKKLIWSVVFLFLGLGAVIALAIAIAAAKNGVL